MLLKVIVCNVPPNRRAAFDHAQEQWRAIATVDGFCGQLGGWSALDDRHAIVLAFWRDRCALDRFMQSDHDCIVQRSRQSETYTAIDVTHFEVELVTLPLAETSDLRIDERAVEFLHAGVQLLTIPIRRQIADIDRITIVPTWTVEPMR